MKPIWKEIIRIVVNAIVAITTVLTATSCMQVNKRTDESPREQPVFVQPSKSSNYGE